MHEEVADLVADNGVLFVVGLLHPERHPLEQGELDIWQDLWTVKDCILDGGGQGLRQDHRWGYF